MGCVADVADMPRACWAGTPPHQALGFKLSLCIYLRMLLHLRCISAHVMVGIYARAWAWVSMHTMACSGVNKRVWPGVHTRV